MCDKKRKMRGNKWEDHYARRARDERWLARSVYKLEEIDKKFKVIHRRDRLLDLGCYPGSWSQYGIKRTGPKGEILGIDLIRPERLSSPNFRFIQGDILTMDPDWLVGEIRSIDVVLSDLAPKTTGNRTTDSSRSMDLARRAAEIAFLVLKEKGRLVCKIFESEDLKHFSIEVSSHFNSLKLFKPKAVRKGSREIYLLGFGFIKK